MRLDATAGNPVNGLCPVVADGGDGTADLAIDALAMPHGPSCHIDHRDRQTGRDLLLWLDLSATAPLVLAPSRRPLS